MSGACALKKTRKFGQIKKCLIASRLEQNQDGTFMTSVNLGLEVPARVVGQERKYRASRLAGEGKPLQLTGDLGTEHPERLQGLLKIVNSANG